MLKGSLVFFALMFVSMVPTTVTRAYQVTELAPTVQYEVQEIPNPQDEQLIIGRLKNDPIMYEVVSDEEFELDVMVRGVPTSTAPRFALIVVRVLSPRGVEEVARQQVYDATYEVAKDSVSRLPYLVGPHVIETLPPGTYQIEVSTPENRSDYILAIGTRPSSVSYLSSLSSLKEMYRFYGASPLGMVRSPLVFYPLLVLILLVALGYLLYRRRDIFTTRWS